MTQRAIDATRVIMRYASYNEAAQDEMQNEFNNAVETIRADLSIYSEVVAALEQCLSEIEGEWPQARLDKMESYQAGLKAIAKARGGQ